MPHFRPKVTLFFARNNFFSIFVKKKKEKETISDDQNAQTWVKFGPKWVIFEFSTKKRNRYFFRLQRLDLVQKIRKFQCVVFEKKWKTSVLGISNIVWGEGGHKVGKNGEKWIFCPK